MPKIYISSTYEDLKEYREAVSHALRKIKADAIAMEDYVAQDQRPLQNCLDDVASSDIYVGIFAWRYGYIPYDNNNDTNPNNLSITELEYRKAQEKGIPCLIFLLDESVPWPLKFSDGTPQSGTSGDDINRLRNELKKNHSISYFKSPYELASNVLAAINSRDIRSQVNVDKLYRNKDTQQLSNVNKVGISGTEVRSISKHTASESANKNLKEPKINKDISAYKEFKLQYQSYMNSDDISVTDVWTKGLRPLIAQFDPNKYNNLNEYSKSRINSLSTLLRRSFKELANKRGINNQDVKEIEDSIDKYLQEISKLYETIFE